jgi:transposase
MTESGSGSSVPKPRDLDEAFDVIATLREQLQRSQRENDLLRHQLDSLCRRMFGKKSEKVDPAQLCLAYDVLEGADMSGGSLELDSGENIPKIHVRGHGRKRSKGRRPLPAELPRERQVMDVDEADKKCTCGRVKEQIGELVTEKLEYVPSSFFVRETVRPKYACGRCHNGVSVAAAPVQAVEKAIAGEGLLAHVVVSKYADHTPLHRLEGIFARHGVDIPRTTMTDWVGSVADALSPVVEQMKDEITQTDYIQTDDTPVKVLAYRSTGYKGRLWAYLDPLNRQVVFDATQTHERDGPMKFLANFEGYLQADAYSGYDELYRTMSIVEVGCWAHGRRRFVDALVTDSRADMVIALVQKLYRIEHEISELSPEERKEHRQQYSKPLLEQLDETRKELQTTLLPKSPLGEAVGYITNQWTALNRFLEDGRLRIDNNGAEYQLRAVAVGRKNWLFAGSFEGARRAATLYSLIQSCRLVSIDPFLYFRDVLVRVATHPQRQIAELTPRMWATRLAQKSAA